jgi:hypothetical protein
MREALLASVITLSSLLGGCGGSAAPQVTTPTLTISLSPSSSQSVLQGTTLKITATVNNDSTGKGVSWSLSGVGSLSAQTSTSVTYNAPANVASNSAATVSAVSVADSSVSASLTITVTPPGPLPLGTVSNVASTACPADFFSSITECSTATVSCPGTDDLGVTFGSATPPGTIKGTIFLHAGAAGTTALTAASYVDSYYAGGYRVVDLEWQSDWEIATSAGTENIKLAACRPATLLQYVYENIHGGATGQGAMCAHGNSAGAAAMAYAITWYGSGAFLDKLLLTSGPVLSDIEAGCEVPNVPPITVCPAGQFGCVGSPWTDFPQYQSPVNALQTWTGDPTCNNVPAGQSTSSASNAAWKAQSIVDGTPNANFSYPQTAVSGWLCAPAAEQNNSAAQAQYFYEQILGPSQVAQYSVNRIEGCTSDEDIWNGTTTSGSSGFTSSVADMLDPVAGCVKRH